MVHPTPSPEEFEPPVVELADDQSEGLVGILEALRDNWQNARHDPNQSYDEDDIHQSITVLNDLLERIESVSGTEGPNCLKIHSPAEIQEILFSILSVMNGIKTGEIDYGPQQNKRLMVEYEALLDKFAGAHWNENPLAQFWHQFGDLTPDSPEDPVIEAIVKHGDRTHLLRELSARKNISYSLSALENPERLDADPDNPEDVAKAFISEWDNTINSMNHSRYQQWLSEAEHHVGHVADLIEETFTADSEPPVP